MCGIAGCVTAEGARPDPELLRAVAGALAHRGPDDEGIEIRGNVGLVHRRLAIVDPSPAGHAPMASASGDWLLTYNGEVFNHLELREQLGPRRWRGGSDTESVLAALEAWQEHALTRFNGLFALAALDRSRGRLLLARDRFGVKPLYVASHEGTLWFASEMSALLAAGVPPRLRRAALEHSACTGWINGPATEIEGVEKLLPGRLAWVDLATGAVQQRSYYEPVDMIDGERARGLAGLGRSRARGELEEGLRTAVRRRLMSDVPVGVMCSGGIDSSLITLFVRDEQRAITAFNASIVDQPDVDEGDWARRVAAHLGIELDTIRLDGDAFRAALVPAVAHNEHPIVHPGSVPMTLIAASARARGVKVLLSGEGADELFGGYDWLHTRALRAFDRPDPARRAIRIARAGVRRLLRRPGPASGQRLRGPMSGARSFEDAVEARALVAYGHHRGARRRLEAGLAADLRLYLPSLLNRQDKCTMISSVETRVPFLDPDLVALALNLPLEHRVLPERKGILRDLCAKLLPLGIAQRPKIGFGFDTMRYIEPAARPEFLVDGYLRDALAIPRDRWARWLARANPLCVWSTEIWCRLTLDGQGVAGVERELWKQH